MPREGGGMAMLKKVFHSLIYWLTIVIMCLVGILSAIILIPVCILAIGLLVVFALGSEFFGWEK